MGELVTLAPTAMGGIVLWAVVRLVAQVDDIGKRLRGVEIDLARITGPRGQE